MSGIDIAACEQALDRLCARVALAREAQLPRLGGTAEPPEGAALWSGSYAKLLLWPVKSSAPSAIVLAADEGEGWLDAALVRVEQTTGVPVDGYLVLALPSAPEAEASDDIRRVELSARICRKHLVWPATVEAGAVGAEPWARVADITVLGLPDAITAAGDTLYWPEIGEAAEALFHALQAKGPAAVAQADVEAPSVAGTIA